MTDELNLAAQVQIAIKNLGIAGRITVEETPMPGVVRLAGEVFSEEAKLQVDEAARSAEGVLDVIDEIRLTGRR